MEIKQVLKGWGNFVLKELNFLDERTKKTAEQRMLICSTCPVRTIGKCDKTKTGIVLEDFHYTPTNENRKKGQEVHGCGCPLEKKLLSDSQCPIKAW